jgi:hypothetical protein
MNRPEICFESRETERSHGSRRPNVIRPLLVLCVAGALMLLLASESHRSLEQRQQEAFEASAPFP